MYRRLITLGFLFCSLPRLAFQSPTLRGRRGVLSTLPNEEFFCIAASLRRTCQPGREPLRVFLVAIVAVGKKVKRHR